MLRCLQQSYAYLPFRWRTVTLQSVSGGKGLPGAAGDKVDDRGRSESEQQSCWPSNQKDKLRDSTVSDTFHIKFGQVI